MKNKTKLKLLLLILIPLTVYISIINIAPFFVKINIKDIPQSKKIYDTNGVKIGEEIVKGKYRHTKQSLKKYPDFLKKALILLEDRRFYQNNGIDFIAILRAGLNNLKTGKKIEGASTISSQLIRNNEGLNKKRSYKRKFFEFIKAIKLNKEYNKKEILEIYMNTVNFGHMVFGFETASEYFFNKKSKNLTKAEQIVLLTIPKNPNKYSPYKDKDRFKKRYKKIINYFYKNKLISENEYLMIKNEKIDFQKEKNTELLYIKDFLKNRKQNKKGMNALTERKQISQNKIYTTIDYYLTQKIKKIGNRVLSKLKRKNVNDYGILVIKKDSNEIKVMIGGQNYYGENGQVNSTTSPRQVGSTIKPFSYLLSFKNLGYNPQTKITDLPVLYKTHRGYPYEPKNYNLEFKGEVSLAKALAQSLNIPAVKIAKEVGTKKILSFLRKLGISSLTKKAEHYGVALTLGVGNISLFELTRAYNIFANNGKLCEFKILKNKKYKCQKIIDKKYIQDIVYILSNRYFKLQSFPINSNLDFPDRFVFRKTGTSRNFTDNFTIGFTRNYIIGVWVGNKNGEMMKGVSGSSGAGKIFKEIVYTLEKKSEISSTPQTNSRSEKFLKITSPLDGSIFRKTKNPESKTEKIKLKFKTNLKYDSQKRYLNDKEYKGDFINLKKGKHRLKLKLFKNGNNIAEKQIIFDVKKEKR